MNNNFNIGRGVVFEANSSFQLKGAGLWIDPITFNLSFHLYEISSTISTDLTIGATLLTTGTSSHTDTGAGLSFYDVLFPTVTLEVGKFYYLNASFPENVDADQLFHFDAVRRGDAPVNLGLVTLIDGTGNHDTDNSDTPFIRINYEPVTNVIPEPTSLTLLGIGAVSLFGFGLRRKRMLAA